MEILITISLALNVWFAIYAIRVNKILGKMKDLSEFVKKEREKTARLSKGLKDIGVI